MRLRRALTGQQGLSRRSGTTRIIPAIVIGLSLVAGTVTPVAAAVEPVGMALDSAWEVEQPTEGKLAVNADGSVTITTEPGTINDSSGMNNTLYYPLPNQTDYVFTVKVSGSFTANFQGANLMVASGKDRENAVGVVRRYHDFLGGRYGSNLLMGVMQNGGSPNEYYEGAGSIGDEFYLRLQKQNGRISGSYASDYSINAGDWNQIVDSTGAQTYETVDKGAALVDPENIYLALAASNGGGSTPTDITFSDLRVDGQPVPLGVDTAALDSVALSGADKMAVGESGSQTLSLTGSDFDDNPITDFDAVVYSSSDEDVATVSGGGVVTGLRDGIVTITAQATKGDVTRTATLQIQVGEIGVEDSWQIASPDGGTSMTVEMITGGTLQYSATKDDVTNIETSPLGLVTDLGDFSRGLELKAASAVTETNETYDVLSGKSDQYTNHYREQTLTFVKQAGDDVEFDVVIRAYDDATAYRYAVRSDGQGTAIKITDEVSGLTLPASADVHWMDYSSATWNYEGFYETTTTEGLPVGSTPSMPFLYGKDDVWTLVTEADLNGSYTGSMLTVTDTGELDVSFSKTQGTRAVVTTTPFSSPWRTAITGTPSDIVENTIVENLSTPADYETYDYDSWVKPGLSSWSWVANWGSGISDQSLASTHLRWIEFGEEIGWDYYILDEGWALGGRGNVQGVRDWFPEVKAFAEEKDVDLWAWVHVADIDTQAERDKHFSEWKAQGIVGIKPDFFDGEDQRVMQLYDDLYRDAAKYQLMVLAHGANKPTGEVRTYPNVLSREAIRGQESGGITAEQYTTIPFIRAAIGPVEVTEELRSKDASKTTMGFQVALTALFESGIHSMGSAPDVYRNVPEAMSYYRDYPSKWDETDLLDGEVGEQLSMARRAGNNWYISGISVDPRTMSVPMTSLDPGEQYTVLLLEENGRQDIDSRVISGVTSESVIDVNVLYGGGYALRAIPTAELDAITSIVADPGAVTVEAGQSSDPVTVGLTPEDAEFTDVRWSVADESIATVDQRGVIRGVAPGTTVVSVTSAYDATVKADVAVEVIPARYVLDTDMWTILEGNNNVVINGTDSVTVTTEPGVLGGDWNNLFAMDVPDGDRDFTISAKISGGLNANYQGGFITVFDRNDPNAASVAAGRRYHSYLMPDHPQSFGVMSTSTGTSEFYSEDSDFNSDVYVKLEKAGEVFTSWYSRDGITWTEITNKGTSVVQTNAELAASPDLAVGFYAGSGGGSSPIDVTFSEFTYNGTLVATAVDTAPELDTTAPELDVVVSPVEPNGLEGWWTSSVTVTATATDDSEGTVLVEHRIGDGEWTEHTEPVVVTEDGTYVVHVRATDETGNVMTTDALTVNLDKTAPVVDVSGLTDGTELEEGTTVDLAVTATDATSGVASIRVLVDGEAVDAATSWEPTVGAHTVEVTATDVAGLTTTVAMTFTLVGVDWFDRTSDTLDALYGDRDLSRAEHARVGAQLAAAERAHNRGDARGMMQAIDRFEAQVRTVRNAEARAELMKLAERLRDLTP